MQQPEPPARKVRSWCAFFPMSTSQDERVSSVRPPSCTPPSRSSLIQCNMVEPLGCVPFAVAESLSNQHENVFGDVVVDGEKSNKSLNVVGVIDIQGPSKVTTKGPPKSKRLGVALEKSFKNSDRRKNKNASPVIRSDASQDVNLGAVVGWNVPKQAGGFMSLLSSFNKS
ncbi:uncharacterized protein DS421_8g223770 [Arachis hypogaea]|nr:uncharacterized protein DS421_8g223770 [Arachis hypogaea]